ncbi:hypothetical protein [Rhodococcus opacus]|uniref:Uncharacterized protein n=1 Tax=Rhodococcus opacus (strain B4) TaxID=632772 RepID=C1B9E1_RHOOB|nr:hypothetical protein [Rhodococcus opacus]BAH52294.1 hypothetical protein ROP_40470 [Rhodococcus opacus B4]
MAYYLHGYDLNQWFRDERDWRELFELKDQFPPGSAYKSALMEDDEIAEYLANQPESPPANPDDPIPFRWFDPTAQRLTDMIDLLVKVVYASAGNDPNAAPTAPRPVPKHVLIRRERKRKRLRNRVSQLIPGAYAP